MNLEIILAPILTLVVVQVIKLATDGIKGNFDLKHLVNTYGGMPSSHTAFVVSLTSMIGFKEGASSAAFAVAATFSLLFISDAAIFRKHVGVNSQALKKLIDKLPNSEKKQFPEIQTKLGHTLLQIITGGLIGFIIAYLIQLLYI